MWKTHTWDTEHDVRYEKHKKQVLRWYLQKQECKDSLYEYGVNRH